MGAKQNIKKNAAYYLTLTVVDWIDIFTRQNHRDLLINSLKYCIKNKGLNIYAYCIMTNHIHMIASTDEPFELKDTIRDFKKHTTKKLLFQITNEPESRREWILEALSKNAKESSKHQNYKLWQTGNHAIEVFSPKFTWDKINYIHNNPVETNLVQLPEHWIYSSASNYHQLPSVLEEVICISQIVQTY